jgi:hypothetical protein
LVKIKAFRYNNKKEMAPLSLLFLLILTLLQKTSGTTTSSSWWSWSKNLVERLGVEAMGFDSGDTCGYTRDDALLCIATYVDANHDKEISADEFERARRLYLPTQARLASSIAKQLGYGVTISDVMWGCDVAPKDGHLTLSDWKGGGKTCLPGKADLCKLKTVCDNAKKKKKEQS